MVFADRPLCWLDRQPDRPRRRFGSYYQPYRRFGGRIARRLDLLVVRLGAREHVRQHHMLYHRRRGAVVDRIAHTPRPKDDGIGTRAYTFLLFTSQQSTSPSDAGSLSPLRAADCFFTYFLRPSPITYTTVIQLFTTPTGGADAACENRIPIRKIV